MMQPLRVLLVADMEPNRDSGAAGTDMEIADELERQGHEVVRRWGDSFRHRIRHWNLYHLVEQPAAMKRLVARELDIRAFDVVQVAQPAGWLAARALRHREVGERKPLFVHRSHGFEPRIGGVVAKWQGLYREDRRPAHRRVASRLIAALIARNYRGIVRHAEAHVVSCGECADYLVQQGVARERVHVSPQVPTPDFFSTPAPEMTPERLRRVLHVGQHRFFKAPMIVAEVLGELLARDPLREATWVCEPAALAAVADRLAPGIRERVTLVPWQPRERLLEIYDRHGVFLFPSFAEGFGKVFLEAMARGACVLATDQGGARDLIRSGTNGALAPVGDVGALVREGHDLLGNLQLAREIGLAARRTAGSFTWPRVVGDLAEFYRERLRAKGSSS